MSKKLVGIKVSPLAIGLAGSDGQQAEFRMPSAQKSRQPGSSTHVGAYLSEMRERLRRVFSIYDTIAIQSSEYGLNVNSFLKAEELARMTGVVILAAYEHKIRVIEVHPKDVSELAIGRKGATMADYLDSAVKNGMNLKSEYAAEAYWIMSLASKD